MNKRQAKKRNNFKSEQEFHAFMTGFVAKNWTQLRKIIKWEKIELKRGGCL